MKTTRILAFILGVTGLGVGVFCLSHRPPQQAPTERSGPSTQSVDIVVDDRTVAGTDVFALVEPVWNAANIYDGWSEYEESLRPFTLSQRHLFAIEWYRAEVNNGGHDQFFSNSTGIVWEDAVRGFEAIGLIDGANILRTASQRIGGAARDRSMREAQLEATNASFDDLDTRFYKLEETGALDRMMLGFARGRPHDFHFRGRVERLVFTP